MFLKYEMKALLLRVGNMTTAFPPLHFLYEHTEGLRGGPSYL